MCYFSQPQREHRRNSEERIQAERREEHFLAGVGANDYRASTEDRPASFFNDSGNRFGRRVMGGNSFFYFLLLVFLCDTTRKLHFCTGKCHLRIELLVPHSGP